tara:strand:+ start:4177 stop:4794 length:618 start_codon:yes stop_codon:yes gene_type:complete
MKSKFPEGKVKSIQGKCMVLKGDDIDTDRIIPARFLKCVSFHALGDQVFADDRIELKGLHPFDLKINEGSRILVVNNNFGCGSSREHAPQALMRWGIRAVIGESFAEIFYGNCLSLGIPCATSSKEEIEELQKHIEGNKNSSWLLDVEKKNISLESIKINLRIEKGPREMLITGKWDATSQLIAQIDNLNKTKNKLPYLNKFRNY